MSNIHTYYSLDWRITIGKYKGQTLRTILKFQKGIDWVKWALRTVEWFKVDSVVMEYIKEQEDNLLTELIKHRERPVTFQAAFNRQYESNSYLDDSDSSDDE